MRNEIKSRRLFCKRKMEMEIEAYLLCLVGKKEMRK